MVLESLLGHVRQLQSVPDVESLPDTELRKRLLEYLIARRVDNYSYKTLVDYRDFIGCFIVFVHLVLHDPPLLQIDRNHIRLYVLSQQEKIGRYGKKPSPEAVSAYYRAVHTFFNWMETEGIIPEGKNPFAKLTAPCVPEKLVRSWSDDVVDKILKVTEADKTFVGMRNRAFALVLFDSRVSEKDLAGFRLT